MCDYSLACVASRTAEVGDKLVTSRFLQSFTRGFSVVGEPDVAICLLPGTELAFDADVRCEGEFNRPAFALGSTTARFRHIDENEPHRHHDALEFANGMVVLLTQLNEGQRATVLQLPVEAVTSGEIARTKSDEVVGI